MKRLIYYVAVCCVALGMAAHAQTPLPPSDLSAAATKELPLSIALRWSVPPTMPPILPTVFKIFRSVDDSTGFTLLNITTVLAYDDHQVSPGHTYYYYVTRVFVVNDTVSYESGRSNTAWAHLLPSPNVPLGTINGTVRDSVSGTPIPFARVLFFRRAWQGTSWIPQAWADSVGRYSAVLDTGTYLINCQPPFWMAMSMSMLPPYLTKWYMDAYEPSQATPVTVTDGSTFTADFNMVRAPQPLRVHLRGTVRDSAGIPLKGALVVITRTVQEMGANPALDDAMSSTADEMVTVEDLGCIRGVVWKTWTDSTGAFDAAVLSLHSYTVMAVKKGYMPQFFDHTSNPSEATILTPTGDVNNVDFNLSLFRPPQIYEITGVVQDSAGVRVPSRIIVLPLGPPGPGAVRFGFTDSLGAYAIGRVAPGKYLLLALPFGQYAPAFYKKDAFGVIRWKMADTVAVVDQNVGGIDIGVVKIHCRGVTTLAGVVSSAGHGVGGVNVLALSADGTVVGYGMTDNAGAYAIDGLCAEPLTIVADMEGFDGVEQMVSIGPSDFLVTQNFSLGITTTVHDQKVLPLAYALAQNYPNPFNPSTRISFSLPIAGTVTLKVFNLLGQEVRTLVHEYLSAGDHDIAWDGRDAAGKTVSSGVYFYRMDVAKANGGYAFTSIRKMLLIR